MKKVSICMEVEVAWAWTVWLYRPDRDTLTTRVAFFCTWMKVFATGHPRVQGAIFLLGVCIYPRGSIYQDLPRGV